MHLSVLSIYYSHSVCVISLKLAVAWCSLLATEIPDESLWMHSAQCTRLETFTVHNVECRWRTVSYHKLTTNPSCVTAFQVINQFHGRSTIDRILNPNSNYLSKFSPCKIHQKQRTHTHTHTSSIVVFAWYPSLFLRVSIFHGFASCNTIG